MASQISPATLNRAPSSGRSWATNLTILAVIAALLSALVYYIDSHLEDFYIFTPPKLHDLSLRAISAHGNDTRAVVAYIVGELSERLPGGYVNLDEEWIFNNAGGAMGAMYIIHASKLYLYKRKFWPGSKLWSHQRNYRTWTLTARLQASPSI